MVLVMSWRAQLTFLFRRLSLPKHLEFPISSHPDCVDFLRTACLLTHRHQSLDEISKYSPLLEQQVSSFKQYFRFIFICTGQHFYILIVHNTGSCPSLMLASYEPETQKSTAALVRLKAVSDPKQFFNLQSSSAAVIEQRSTSSLPTGKIYM